MKTLPFLLVVFLNTLSEAQTPRSEFALELSTQHITIKPGETREIEMKIHRAKGYQKAKARLGLSSFLPDGITITLEPADGVIQSSKIKVVAAEKARETSNILLLNCTLNNKSKAVMLKLTVTAQEEVTRRE